MLRWQGLCGLHWELDELVLPTVSPEDERILGLADLAFELAEEVGTDVGVLLLAALRLYPLFEAGKVDVLDAAPALAGRYEGVVLCGIVDPAEAAEGQLLVEALAINIVEDFHVFVDVFDTLHLCDLSLVVNIHLSHLLLVVAMSALCVHITWGAHGHH